MLSDDIRLGSSNNRLGATLTKEMLVFPANTGWTVLDFKTDGEFDKTSEVYVAQVRPYSQAVRAATSAPLAGSLLVVRGRRQPHNGAIEIDWLYTYDAE